MLTNHGPRCDGVVEGSEVTGPQGAEPREGCRQPVSGAQAKVVMRIVERVANSQIELASCCNIQQNVSRRAGGGGGVILCPFALLPNQWS